VKLVRGRVTTVVVVLTDHEGRTYNQPQAEAAGLFGKLGTLSMKKDDAAAIGLGSIEFDSVVDGKVAAEFLTNVAANAPLGVYQADVKIDLGSGAYSQTERFLIELVDPVTT
jgi:hypothetical protein